MIPKLNNICDCCESDQPIIQLFDDKCFKIIDGSETEGSFCLNDFVVPVDGHSCLSINLNAESGETLIFDNKIVSIGSPSTEVTSGNSYARGVIIQITYPTNDDNSEEISIVDKNVELWIEDAETLTYTQYPLYNLFSLFTNPKSKLANQLINRIKIVNPNEYRVKVTGLVTFGEAI